MSKHCTICKNPIHEVTLIEEKTPYCSAACIKGDVTVQEFKKYIERFFQKYKYATKEDLLNSLQPELTKKMITELVAEVKRRGYFTVKGNFIYPTDKKISLTEVEK